MGVPALGAARAPFVDYDTVYFEHDRKAYLHRLESFLAALRLEVPEDAVRNTRRFMYYRYYRFSLPFGDFIEFHSSHRVCTPEKVLLACFEEIVHLPVHWWMDFCMASALNWMSSCSVVIRAYNEAGHIRRLLQGLSQQTVRDVEIILVDSGSTDSTVALASAAGAKVVHIPPADFTFGRSLNLGLDSATCDLVVIASAHVYPLYPDWLERLLKPFTDRQVALTYGKQRAPVSAYFSEQQVYRRWYPEHSDSHQKEPFCNNANAAVRLSAWKMHPYDETLTGLEDLAWAKWALGEGFSISYVPEAEIIHVHRETRYAVYNRYKREAMAFKQIYPEAHFSIYDFTRMASANIASDLWHSSKQKRFLKTLPGIFWYRVAQFWGTYQGYRCSPEWNWNLRQAFYYPHGRNALDKPAPTNSDPIRYNE